MNQKRKKTNKTILILVFFAAVIAVCALIHFFPFQSPKKLTSQYVLACPIKGKCFYKYPESPCWKKFYNKEIALPINSSIMTQNDSSMNLVFSSNSKIHVSENTQIKVRYRHKRTPNPVANMYKLVYRNIKGMLSKEDFRLGRPTVLSTIE